jgi:hypothetical protein
MSDRTPRQCPSRRAAILSLAALSLAALFIAPALPAPALGANSPSTAKPFLEDIYRRYVGSSQADAKGIPLAGPDVVRRYFSPGLASLILDDRGQAASDGQPPRLHGDPFVGRQDWQIEALAITVKDATQKAVATVTFTNFGKPETVVVELLKLDTTWRIADIRWEAGTLRGLFRN